MIYSSDVNQSIYVAAKLKGCVLRANDLTRAFAKMARKKSLQRKQKSTLIREVNRNSR